MRLSKLDAALGAEEKFDETYKRTLSLIFCTATTRCANFGSLCYFVTKVRA